MQEADIIKNYSSDTANSVIEAFYSELVSREDQKLFDLTFAKKIEQKQLDEFLKEWDIEKFGERKSMILLRDEGEPAVTVFDLEPVANPTQKFIEISLIVLNYFLANDAWLELVFLVLVTDLFFVNWSDF